MQRKETRFQGDRLYECRIAKLLMDTSTRNTGNMFAFGKTKTIEWQKMRQLNIHEIKLFAGCLRTQSFIRNMKGISIFGSGFQRCLRVQVRMQYLAKTSPFWK